MQRFKQPNMDLHPDGEWIRYEDHVEAMKRIAGAPVEKQAEREALKTAADASAFIERKAEDYARDFGTNDMGSLSFGNEDMRIYHWHLVELADEIRALAAPSASAQQALTGWVPAAPNSLPPPDTDLLVMGKDRCGGLRRDVAGMFSGHWMSQATQNNCDFEVTHWMLIPGADTAAPAPSASPADQVGAEAKHELTSQIAFLYAQRVYAETKPNAMPEAQILLTGSELVRWFAQVSKEFTAMRAAPPAGEKGDAA